MLLNRSFTIAAIVVGCAMNCCCPGASAQNTDIKNPATAKANPYALPKNASADQLGQFLEKLKTERPRTAEENKQRIVAVYECSSALLKGKADEKYRVPAAEAMLGVLSVMPRVDKDFKGPTQIEFAKTLAADPSPAVALIGKHFAVSLTARNLLVLTKTEKAGLIEEAFGLVRDYGLGPRTFSLLNLDIAQAFEKAGKAKEAINIYKRLAPLAAKSKDKRIVAYKPKLDGAVRRLELLGNPIELGGPTNSGAAFDWAPYRGKVVLVDFWATWCVPCVAELPNMKKNYADFHDDGFEIVGVNMDSNRERFEKFIGDRDVPWPHIMGTEKQFGWDHPIAVRYGIYQIPTQMLIGRDGKVIALNLTGRKLDRKLEELFSAEDK